MSMMTEATSAWQNDCAAYLPAREPKKAAELIMHGSCVIVFAMRDTAPSARSQPYYTGISGPLPDKFSRGREISVQRGRGSIIMKMPSNPRRRSDTDDSQSA